MRMARGLLAYYCIYGLGERRGTTLGHAWLIGAKTTKDRIQSCLFHSHPNSPLQLSLPICSLSVLHVKPSLFHRVVLALCPSWNNSPYCSIRYCPRHSTSSGPPTPWLLPPRPVKRRHSKAIATFHSFQFRHTAPPCASTIAWNIEAQFNSSSTCRCTCSNEELIQLPRVALAHLPAWRSCQQSPFPNKQHGFFLRPANSSASTRPHP